LYYHLLSNNLDRKALINNDGTQLKARATDKKYGPTILTTSEKIIAANSFVKASDVKFSWGIKLSPVNTSLAAEQKQKVATDSDKVKLQKDFDSGQQTINESVHYDALMQSYDYALANAAVVLRSSKATLAQVDQAIWLLKTTKTQIKTLNFPEFA